MIAHTLFQKSLDLIYPPRCVHCKTSGSWLCPRCFAQIHFITSQVCERCGTPHPANSSAGCRQCRNNPLHSIDGIRVAAYFENNPIRSLIHFLKYRNHRAIPAVLGDILHTAYQQYRLQADVIMPVPLHRSRLKERGYNQSELVARQLGRLLALPVDTHSLQRTKKTRSQMTLGAKERHQNVANAFVCQNGLNLAGQTILLIDDVCTTGSTLDACAAALKESEGGLVWGLALAKAR